MTPETKRIIQNFLLELLPFLWTANLAVALMKKEIFQALFALVVLVMFLILKRI